MQATAQSGVAVGFDYKVVVIGSGFGGAVVTCRTAKRWGNRVLLLERGKRYPMGSFPRSPRRMAENFWNLPFEDHDRPVRMKRKDQVRGLFDIRNGKHIDIVVSAGLGGGSLIYANVFLKPPAEVFDDGWPRDWRRDHLEKYYAIVKAVLGAGPIPEHRGDPRRKVRRARLFDEVAERYRRHHAPADIAVFFGNNRLAPTPIGRQEVNRYGAVQTSCTYCGECDVGCNTHSKNTLDLNYLHVAEARYDAEILTEHLATKIVPLNIRGDDDPSAHGEHGYRVYFLDLKAKAADPKVDAERSVRTRRVVLSAGALGSTELLMRCRDIEGTLPDIPAPLGRRFSGNGDFLIFAMSGKRKVDPNYGPVITRITDYNLFHEFQRDRAFILQDAAFPAFGAWFAMGARPALSMVSTGWKAIRGAIDRIRHGASLGRVGFIFGDVLKDDPVYRSSVLLCMGLDKGTGRMALNDAGYLQVDWPYRQNWPLYRAILRAARGFGRHIGARWVLALPTWWWPFRNNVTVHALGGCILADSPQLGVTSAAPGHVGEVFGYTRLYVADGAIVPTALGANPSATIAALAEMIAEEITGLEPHPDL